MIKRITISSAASIAGVFEQSQRATFDDRTQIVQEAGVAQLVISRLEQGLQADFKISVIAAVAKATLLNE